MIHRKPKILAISCSLVVVATAVITSLYARQSGDTNLAGTCDGFDYRFVYKSHHIGMSLRNGEKFSPVIHPAEFSGCVRIDSVMTAANGSVSVRGEIRLQGVTYGERHFLPDATPWQPLLGFEATYGHPRKGKMRWEFREPDGTLVGSSWQHTVLAHLCAPFAEAVSPGVFRNRWEITETETGAEHVFYKLGENPWANVVGWYLRPGEEKPVRIYAESYRDNPDLPRPTLSFRLSAVAIDPLASSPHEPTQGEPINN